LNLKWWQSVIPGFQSLLFKCNLCRYTEDKTFLVKRVETSNTLLLVQPPGGLDDRIAGRVATALFTTLLMCVKTRFN
jgi:hypothetical protein